MLATRSPADLARDTIRQLALRRLAPTPDNYGRVYAELSGEPAPVSAPAPAPASVVAAAAPASPAANDNWPDLVRNLMRRWEARTPQWTQGQKRESLDRLLAAAGSDPAKLHSRLSALVRAWGEGPANDAPSNPQAATAIAASSAPSHGSAAPVAVAQAAPRDASFTALRDMVIELLRFIAGHDEGGGSADAALDKATADIVQKLSHVNDHAELAAEAPLLRKHILRVELAGRGQRELLRGLMGLLHLVVSNIEELVPDERWVKGQIEKLRDTLSRPLSVTGIADAETAMRSVIVKQGTLKKSIGEAEGAMKAMLADFIDRLGGMSDSADDYSRRIEGYSERIRGANDMPALSGVVKALLDDTREVQANTMRVRDELEQARTRALEFEAKARQLESELEDVSALVCSDPLTGALNRRGLADSTSVEFARATRDGTQLSLAVLDLDNFKKLNDSLGHAAGDEALKHLAAVLRKTLRPTDVTARYGGEEFVIVLPDTNVNEAANIMMRVQRGLTRSLFMHGNDKLLITFSAGVAAWDGTENEAALVARADEAMYQAKQTGKNRVVVAEAVRVVA